jgi:hypothetical protein
MDAVEWLQTGEGRWTKEDAASLKMLLASAWFSGVRAALWSRMQAAKECLAGIDLDDPAGLRQARDAQAEIKGILAVVETLMEMSNAGA